MLVRSTVLALAGTLISLTAAGQGAAEAPDAVVQPPQIAAAPGGVATIAPGPVTIQPHMEDENLSFLQRLGDITGYYALYLWEAVTGSVAPPTPASFAEGVSEKDPYSFWSLLSDAGYKLKEIETDIGLIPDVSLKFKHVRELSEADITWLERKLERHAKKNPGWIPALQRSIVYTLLEVNSSNDYFVDTLTVDLLPLPKAKFSLEPWEGGLPEEFDILLRAIQGREISPRRSMREGS